MTETAADLVAHLRMMDVTLSVEGDQLRMNAPRGALTTELREELGAHKTEILALLRAGYPEGIRTAPASFAQRRMWLLDRIQGDASAYNIPGKLRLTGTLDVDALDRAIVEIVRRHAVLRTTFAMEEGELVQVIHPSSDVRMARVDLTDLARDEREARVRALERSELTWRFDLSRGPLFRLSMVRLAADDHLLIAATHHIVSDGWSMGVFVRELTELYSAYIRGKPSPLAELSVQYADFARWERRHFAGRGLATQLDYWRVRLRPPYLPVDLPTDRPRSTIMTFEGARVVLPVPQTFGPALRALADRQGVTLFMLLLATFKVLLHRFTAQTDIAVGTPVANRSRVSIEGLIGFFVNTLVLRTDVGGNPAFSEYLQQVREIALDAFSHQEIPFEKLVEELKPQRDPSRNPFFQTMFVVRRAGDSELSLPGVKATVGEPLDSGVSKFDLTATVVDNRGDLGIELEYNVALFDHDSMLRLAEAYTTLLGSIIANPDARVDSLDIVPHSDLERLDEWNRTATSDDLDVGLHELVEAQVDRTPSAVAVEFEGASLTYAELDAHANRLSHQLRARGVGQDVLVGVCMERSLEMVIALLGVLKAGGAYVPLDPSYPRARLDLLIDDAGVHSLLTQESLLDRLPADRANVIVVDSALPVERGEGVRAERRARGDDLAYMIYTSGSTGNPKGALNTHRGIVNRLLWMQNEFGLDADDRVLQKTPFSFDVSVWEFFWPLLSGARLVMARPDGHRDPTYLIDTIVRSGVTTVHFVPSMLATFLATRGVEAAVPLRRVIASGEALGTALAERCLSILPAALYNLYGPTEAAVDVTSWRCEPDERRTSVPIGHPISNTTLHVLDDLGQRVPIGIPGELYIGGVNVGRGYHRRPDLTAERFVPDVFAPRVGGRLYRTGDRVRYFANGALEYLGRFDFQVKLRGYRIELGEIEASLASDPRVAGAAVIVREDVPGDRRIVAYVASDAEPGLSAALRETVRARLPEYMVPSAVVVLETLPVTSNGKLDRAALPKPDFSVRSTAGLAAQKPVTQLEREIAAIWSDALKVPDVGVEENFFDLGGHSLLVVQVHERVRELAGRDVSVVTLFRFPTVRSLAQYLSESAPDRPTQDDFAARAQRQRAAARARPQRKER